MKKGLYKKRYITLIEMMIVMFLIAMITGVIAFNYTGSLEEGKAFKTQAGIEKIHTILDLYVAAHPDAKVDSEWEGIVNDSQLVKNPKELLKDGWGQPYTVSRTADGDIEIKSTKYDEYQRGKGKSGLFNNKKDAT